VDSFFMRAGDLLAAGLIFVGTTWLGAGVPAFGAMNLALVVAWAMIAGAVLRRYASKCGERAVTTRRAAQASSSADSDSA
jgi:AAA family ATP:ADP antiporter